MHTSRLTGRLRHLWTGRRTFYFSTWHARGRDGARQPRLTYGERVGWVPHGANGSREGYRQPPSWRAPYGVRRVSCEVVEVKNAEQAGHWCIGEDGGMRGPSGVLASGAGDLRTLKSFPTGSSCCQYDSTSPSHRRHRGQQKKTAVSGSAYSPTSIDWPVGRSSSSGPWLYSSPRTDAGTTPCSTDGIRKHACIPRRLSQRSRG